MSKHTVDCIIIVIMLLFLGLWIMPRVVWNMVEPNLDKMIDSEFDRQVGILIDKEIMENLDE